VHAKKVFNENDAGAAWRISQKMFVLRRLRVNTPPSPPQPAPPPFPPACLIRSHPEAAHEAGHAGNIHVELVARAQRGKPLRVRRAAFQFNAELAKIVFKAGRGNDLENARAASPAFQKVCH
jgi:hypothetical protein